MWLVGKPTNIRNIPDGTIVGSLGVGGEQGEVIQSEGMWRKITTARITGWVHADYLQAIELPHIRLNVPYRSQSGVGASLYPNDCGAACLTMLLDWAHNLPRLSVDEVARAAGMVGAEFTTIPQLMRTGARLKLMTTTRIAPPEVWTALVKNHQPLITLIHYGTLTGRIARFSGAHFVVVTGVEGDRVYLNDPLWGQVNVPLGEFIRAQYDSRIDGNMAYQVIIPTLTPAILNTVIRRQVNRIKEIGLRV